MVSQAELKARFAADTAAMKARHQADQRALEERFRRDQTRFEASGRGQTSAPTVRWNGLTNGTPGRPFVTGVSGRPYPYWNQGYYRPPEIVYTNRPRDRQKDIFGNVLKGFAIGAGVGFMQELLGHRFGNRDEYVRYESPAYYDDRRYFEEGQRYAQAPQTGNRPSFDEMLRAAAANNDVGGTAGDALLHRKEFQQQMLRDFYFNAKQKGEFSGDFKSYLHAALQDNLKNPHSKMPDPRAYLSPQLTKYLDPAESANFYKSNGKTIEERLGGRAIGSDAHRDYHGQFSIAKSATIFKDGKQVPNMEHIPGMSREVAKYEETFPEAAKKRKAEFRPQDYKGIKPVT